MKTKKRYLKYIVIVLVVIFLVSTGLVFLEIWESKHGEFGKTGDAGGVVMYNDKEYVLNDNIETFLVLGLDEYEDENAVDVQGNGVRADFLMLFVINNETQQSTAVHINRDTMTKVNKLAVGGTTVVDSFKRQIALSYSYVNDDNAKIRCRNAKDSVEYLLNGVKVDHYLALTMDSVSASCDLVGGVELTVLDDFTGVDDTLVKGEKVTLNGAQALRYVRSRYGLEDSSNSARMARQQQYINALYDKLVSCIEADESFIVKMIDTMDEYVVYDSSNQKLQKIAEKINGYEFVGIKDIEGESKMGEEYIEFYPNEDFVQQLVIDLFYTPKK